MTARREARRFLLDQACIFGRIKIHARTRGWPYADLGQRATGVRVSIGEPPYAITLAWWQAPFKLRPGDGLPTGTSPARLERHP